MAVPQNGSGDGPRILTAGEIFSDTAIELVRDPVGCEGFKLVRCRQGVSEVKNRRRPDCRRVTAECPLKTMYLLRNLPRARALKIFQINAGQPEDRGANIFLRSSS
jgi:hypothetical protein